MKVLNYICPHDITVPVITITKYIYIKLVVKQFKSKIIEIGYQLFNNICTYNDACNVNISFYEDVGTRVHICASLEENKYMY